MMKNNFYTIIRPIITEKTNALVSNSTYVFAVRVNADVLEIKEAIQEHFKVSVLTVRTCIMQGKAKNFKQRKGKKSDWKKAYVVLKNNDSIDYSTYTTTT
ncbi:MAG: 50S ribosomal protein L23 [Methylacidiphilales bacterium]|nr:50S ribosomal protein L23 [Candidatus Methylacidiphilales bacterium]